MFQGQRMDASMAHLIALVRMFLVPKGRAALAQLARFVETAEDELQRAELVQQQRQAFAACIQRLMKPDLLQ